MLRTGVFGSAFNPPTLGHLDVLRQAAEQFDRVLLVPSAAHAFSKQSLSLDIREQLLEAFCRDAQALDLNCEVAVSMIERDLLEQNPEQPVYTWTLLDTLSLNEPDTEFTFIRGPDNATPQTWSRFYRHADIEARWLLFTVKENSQARSSLVRETLETYAVPNMSREQKEKLVQELMPLLTPKVLTYILEHNLYQESP